MVRGASDGCANKVLEVRELATEVGASFLTYLGGAIRFYFTSATWDPCAQSVF